MLIYGSNFCMVTRYPLALSRQASDEEMMPLPSDDTTPPVTKMYLVSTLGVFFHIWCKITKFIRGCRTRGHLHWVFILPLASFFRNFAPRNAEYRKCRTSVTSQSSRMSTTAKPHSWIKCFLPDISSATTSQQANSSWTTMTSNANEALQSCPKRYQSTKRLQDKYHRHPRTRRFRRRGVERCAQHGRRLPAAGRRFLGSDAADVSCSESHRDRPQAGGCYK